MNKDNGESVFTTTNSSGNYYLFIEEGVYTVSIVETSIPANFTVSPESTEITFENSGNLETIDFCFTADASYNDLKIILLPISQARPGFDAEYRLVYKNVGTTIMSGEVFLQFDDTRQTFLNALPEPIDINNNIITWNFFELLPFQSRTIDLTFNTLPPPINNSDDVLEFQAHINPVEDDLTPDDNTYNLNQIVVNSSDPNDKQVAQGETIYASEMHGYLDYVIRFQNTGTADAIFVRIEDVLSDKLNWNTFQPLTSSHDYRVEITDGNKVAFIFDNIFLPPEEFDPEGSNGYVAFRIKTIDEIALGDVIKNTADIYFDFNEAIITNTVTTTVVENLGVAEFDLDINVRMYPNPVSSTLQIYTSQNISFEKAMAYSLLGENIIETDENEINLETLSSGVYFIKVFTDKGSVTKKIVKE